MSWGIRITIITLGFVAFMSFMVYKAMQQNFDLVTEDYYGKELKFQQQMDRQIKHNRFKEGIRITATEKSLVLHFPEELKGIEIKGSVTFFRPSDKKEDKNIALSLTNGEQIIDKSILKNGLYKVQIDYNSEGEEYYFEDSIIL